VQAVKHSSKTERIQKSRLQDSGLWVPSSTEGRDLQLILNKRRYSKDGVFFYRIMRLVTVSKQLHIAKRWVTYNSCPCFPRECDYWAHIWVAPPRLLGTGTGMQMVNRADPRSRLIIECSSPERYVRCTHACTGGVTPACAWARNDHVTPFGLISLISPTSCLASHF
jgi:hypothetical protein